MRKFPMNLSLGIEQQQQRQSRESNFQHVSPWINWIQWSWLIKCIESVWNWYIILGWWPTFSSIALSWCYTYIDLTDERSKGDWRCLVVEWVPKIRVSGACSKYYEELGWKHIEQDFSNFGPKYLMIFLSRIRWRCCGTL